MNVLSHIPLISIQSENFQIRFVKRKSEEKCEIASRDSSSEEESVAGRGLFSQSFGVPRSQFFYTYTPRFSRD